jgi:hypothetical protein
MHFGCIRGVCILVQDLCFFSHSQVDIVDGAFVLRLARFESTFVRLDRNEKSNNLAPRACLDISKTNLDVFCQSGIAMPVFMGAAQSKAAHPLGGNQFRSGG